MCLISGSLFQFAFYKGIHLTDYCNLKDIHLGNELIENVGYKAIRRMSYKFQPELIPLIFTYIKDKLDTKQQHFS